MLNAGFSRVIKRGMGLLERNIVWLDLELTGLDINKDHIIEIACVVTDQELNVLAKSDSVIIHQDEVVMNAMDSWCTEHHGKSGLTNAVLKSNITTKQAEDTMLQFIKPFTQYKKNFLAGNSIHVDRMFLIKHMPSFVDHLHYRIIDVSTLKTLSNFWYPCIKGYAKNAQHRAVDDIMESISELKYLRQNIFK